MNSSPSLSGRSGASSRPEAIAPAWHTVIVLAALFGISLFGALKGSLPGVGAHGRIPGYCVVMVFEWALVVFIWNALRRRGMRVRELIGGRWERPVQILRDLGIAVVFMLVCGMGLLSGLGYLLKAAPNAAFRNMFPHGAVEITFYLMLTATAGFCEELIFRGYLQRQFAALTQSVVGGIVLQGIAFGASHGYQGWKFMVLISVYGITFGLLAIWRGSLRPGMMAHFLQDAIGGLLGPYLP
jgi:uncharacterized protein